MCSLAFIDQNSLFPSFETSTESSSSLCVPYLDLGKEEFLDSPFFLPLRATMPPSVSFCSEGEDEDSCESFACAALVQKNGTQSPPSSISIIRENKRAEESFQFHKEYIKKRLRGAAYESVSPRQLFEEIKTNGYLGAYSTVVTFVSILRGEKKGPEASFQFHKEYIKKRLTEATSESASPGQLFEEIKAQGYQGTLSTVQTFVSTLREKKRPETSFQFHKEYLRKRLGQAASKSVSSRQLFEEIKAQGYQGALRTVQTFVSMTRMSKSPEASLEFHKEYIKKRFKDAVSESVSTKELLEEIKAKGYQGTLRTVQTFVSMIRPSKAPEESFQFHKKYITKRLEEAASESVSLKQLFEEIKASGYLGSYDTVRKSVPKIRKEKNKRVETSFQFHKKYIIKRLTQAAPESVSTRQLFEEIKANGYLGAYNTVRLFVSTVRDKKNKRAEASLEFHREYVKKRLTETALQPVSAKELFEEIKAKGYQGTLSTVQKFASMIRMSRSPNASLEFHKGYISKRLTEAASKSVSTRQLFEEIRANGYLGVYGRVAAFVSTIRTNRSPKVSLEF